MAVAVERHSETNWSDGLVGWRRHIAGKSSVQFNALCDRVVAVFSIGTYP